MILKTLLVLALIAVVMRCATSDGYGILILGLVGWELISVIFKIMELLGRTVFYLLGCAVKICFMLYIATILLK